MNPSEGSNKPLVIGLNKQNPVIEDIQSTASITESIERDGSAVNLHQDETGNGEPEMSLLSASLSASTLLAGTANNGGGQGSHIFKTGITPQRPRALSPNDQPKKESKSRSVSFSSAVTSVEINGGETTGSSSSSVDQTNVNNNSNASNSDNNSPTSNGSSHLSNNVNNSQKNVFIKLNSNSSSSSEIFQFDEEYEEELEKEKQQQEEQQKKQQQQPENQNSGVTVTTVPINDESDDETADEQQQPRIVIGDNLRSRSGGLKQQNSQLEIKMGSSLPVVIPQRVALPTHKGSIIDPTIEIEKKKYVTPRESWVEIHAEQESNDIMSSFKVPSSLSRKPKSFV